MRRYPKEVAYMFRKRKSDEQIEIVAYLLRYKPIDEDCIDEVSERLDYIKAELRKRGYAIREYGAKENNNDRFVQKERARVKALLDAHRKKLIESTCKREASS